MIKIINLYKKFNKFIKYIILVLSVTKNFKIENIKSNIKKNKKTILIEWYLSDFFMFNLFLSFYKIFDKNTKIIFFISVKNIAAAKFYNFIFNRITKIIDHDKRLSLINIYENKFDYKSQVVKNIKKKVKNKQDVYKIQYKGIKIGKYIYQSYCREYLRFTLDINSKEFLIKIAESINFIERSKSIFKNYKIKYLITSHTIFSKYGCLCKIAKINKCKIFIIFKTNNGKSLDILKIPNNLIQADDYKNYKKIYLKQKNKNKILINSQKELYNRINSQTFHAGLRRQGSSFDKNKIIRFKEKKDKIIILTSCFYDSAMFYENSMFPDCYTWIIYLLDRAKFTNFQWYVKPHPDGVPENKNVINILKKKYPNVIFLDKNISNKSFQLNNFKSMFTYRGSAITEFIYMGIPCVVVSDNIQSAFSFARPLKSINIFNNLINNANKIKLSRTHKKEIHEFNSVFSFRKSGCWKNINLNYNSTIDSNYFLQLTSNSKEFNRLKETLNNIFK